MTISERDPVADGVLDAAVAPHALDAILPSDDTREAQHHAERDGTREEGEDRHQEALARTS